jgi:hypothetical protein
VERNIKKSGPLQSSKSCLVIIRVFREKEIVDPLAGQNKLSLSSELYNKFKHDVNEIET